MHRPMSFARFVAAPENRSALVAVQELAELICAGKSSRAVSPLVLHGPAGTGKTHLVTALVERVIGHAPSLSVRVLSAREVAVPGEAAAVYVPGNLFGGLAVDSKEPGGEVADTARDCDLLVVEDLQHLPLRGVEAVVGLIDDRAARRRPSVFTALVGPRDLGHRGEHFPARLISRLAGGLVVGLEPLGQESRLAYLLEGATRRQIAVPRDVLEWLAGHLSGGGRQLDGALNQLELLGRLDTAPLDVKAVAACYRDRTDGGKPTPERIARKISDYFQVEPRLLRSERRSRGVLLPRQIGMYLARQLTSLSLGQIGDYFGGRDHSTVLHACRKVENALRRDAALNGALRQLQADLA
jgi:chromosomal replication initiator protein